MLRFVQYRDSLRPLASQVYSVSPFTTYLGHIRTSLFTGRFQILRSRHGSLYCDSIKRGVVAPAFCYWVGSSPVSCYVTMSLPHGACFNDMRLRMRRSMYCYPPSSISCRSANVRSACICSRNIVTTKPHFVVASVGASICSAEYSPYGSVPRERMGQIAVAGTQALVVQI